MNGVSDGAALEVPALPLDDAAVPVSVPVSTTSARAATGAASRAFDVVTSLLLLTLSLPVLAVIALVVKLEGGPVLFRQARVGAGGRTIRIAKFRTMSVDAEERLLADPDLYDAYVANAFKLPADEDPRLTRFGPFLRASSLDELPQLWSVLTGEMSMVGPRPIVEDQLREFTQARQEYEAAYLSARPGLTGLWQVSGRSGLDHDQRIALDLEYLQQQSVRTDLLILLRTIPAVLRRTGAH